MAFNNSILVNHVLTSASIGDEAAVSYLASSSHGGPQFEHNLVAPFSMQVGSAQFLDAPLDMSSLVARIGTTPAGFEMPEGAIVASGYNTLGGVPIDVEGVLQPQNESNDKPAPFKGTWTEEEDIILKDMVTQLGERKWSVIAQSLPGRIGKQCRERWINHLRPDIKQNDIWTEEDDKMLIGAHKYFGNRWSSIARFLPGRSENAVKNHWNATRRSLKAKRRLKKKSEQQVPPGQLSVLEEYIRSLPPAAEFAAPAPAASPPLQGPTYSGPIVTDFVHPPAPGMEMNFNSANPVGPALSTHLPGMIHHNMPQLPDLNISCDPQEAGYMSYAMMYAHSPAPQLQLVTQDLQQTTFSWFPFVENLTALNTGLAAGPSSYYPGGSSSNAGANGYNGAGAGYYYSEAGPINAGGSGGEPAGGDTGDVVELASREFLTPSNGEATLDMTRFE